MQEWLASAAVSLSAWFDGVKLEFIKNFITKDRWRMLTRGLGNTLMITFFACLLGIAIGMVVATVRSTWDQAGPDMRPGLRRKLAKLANGVCQVYLTVIRGTPMVVQLMLAYYVVLVSFRNEIMVAIIAFGLNSGAYVAEIIRGGIMSIDKGQFEAGRSLGFNYVQTMAYIIVPQVLKSVLPSLANEFISLLKETSVAGYISIMDLTFAGNRIRGTTYSAFMPLIAVALIYLALVMLFTRLVSLLERRLRNSDH